MVAARLATAAVGVAGSLAVSVVAWQVFDLPVFVLAVPFVPFLFRRRRGERSSPRTRRCPECGFTTRTPSVTHCPHDGTELD
ncbi:MULTISPECIES: hypothetical protein [Halobacterium]|uniref:hypothetical protein n=1 Tax=Halobacterium TaxID=2239 RepID=UPI0019648429|nr:MULTISPECIES: hypothetical protein [Halobacterium]MDL0122362.1 hypothetical protein [Halobacterium salinarum]QRY23888.1 hypothetical protein JRZ79_05565 [Halobacterium sp. BOL4-2]